MALTYKADLESDSKEKAEFEFSKSYDSSALAWACGASAIFLGGYCWFYLVKPTAPDRAAVRKEARKQLDKMNLSRFEIVEEEFSSPRWRKEELKKSITFAK